MYAEHGCPSRSRLARWKDFDDIRAREWLVSFDYGYTRHAVGLLGCTDRDNNLFIVHEHAERQLLPQRHVEAIKVMLARH